MDFPTSDAVFRPFINRDIRLISKKSVTYILNLNFPTYDWFCADGLHMVSILCLVCIFVLDDRFCVTILKNVHLLV